MAAIPDYAWGLIVPAAIAQTFDLPVNDIVQRLPPRKMFYYHFSGKRWPQLNPQDLLHNGLYKKMSQLGLAPVLQCSLRKGNEKAAEQSQQRRPSRRMHRVGIKAGEDGGQCGRGNQAAAQAVKEPPAVDIPEAGGEDEG